MSAPDERRNVEGLEGSQNPCYTNYNQLQEQTRDTRYDGRALEASEVLPNGFHEPSFPSMLMHQIPYCRRSNSWMQCRSTCGHLQNHPPF